MNWTIQRRLVALTALGILVALGASLTGWFGTKAVSHASNRVLAIQLVLRDHTDADMMHDAIRADVLAAIGALNAEERAAAKTDLAEHATRFREAIAANQAATLEPSLKSALDSVIPSLNSYIQSGERIMAEAQRDPAAARGHFGAFMVSFRALEGWMSHLSDLIEASAQRTSDAGQVEVGHANRNTVVLGIVGLVTLIGFAFRLSSSILRPLSHTVEALERVANGDLTTRVTVINKDETGRMAVALNTAVTAMQESLQAIARNAEGLAASSHQLSTVSAQMGSNANETSAQAGVVSAAAEQVSKNVMTVATAAEEMGASIKEIAGNATQAAQVATAAVLTADNTNATIAKLGTSSEEIGNVLKVITSIAEQTNLLALNATIEAARAGEAGKGFAVVANEVKELAKETAKATEDITRKIQAIQADTHGAVAAIGEISGVIRKLNDISGSIASAVEEQAATTNEIGRNVSEAAKGSTDIAQNITGVATAAQSTSTGAQHSQQAAGDLARMAAELQQLISHFRFEDGQDIAPAAHNARASLRIAA